MASTLSTRLGRHPQPNRTRSSGEAGSWQGEDMAVPSPELTLADNLDSGQEIHPPEVAVTPTPRYAHGIPELASPLAD